MSFVVLAIERCSSAFFSSSTAPSRASTTSADAALDRSGLDWASAAGAAASTARTAQRLLIITRGA